ncbi:MAG: amino acid ABC transporter permease [Rhodospirillales bacterium]|nr:amino acid ABC transporter permease [Rhodospirillales bacterium]
MFELRFFEIYRNGDYLLRLAEGIWLSISLTVGAAIIGFVVAGMLAAVRNAKVPVAAQLSAAYVEFIRNTPLIVQLFFVAFGLPLLFGYSWPFWAHALLGLTLNFSAYFAEILRSGLQSISKGQIEAAIALGLKPLQRFRKVIVPQVIASVYPSLTSQFIFLFLTTGVISEIGVEDLTHAGVFIDSRTFRSFEIFITLTLLYVAIALLFKFGMLAIDRHYFAWKDR